MVADRSLAVERGIVGIRLRLGFFGRPVLQIRRQLARLRFVGNPGGVIEVPAGRTAWRIARKRDAIELAQFLTQNGVDDTGPSG